MNIYDIAKEAGVSISTVSRVLNNKSNVKENTRRKVEDVLEKRDRAGAGKQFYAYSGGADCGYPGATLCQNGIHDRTGIQPQRV